MADLLGSSSTLLHSVQRFIFSKLIYLLIIYMLSFLVFAAIRIFTGISIKRLGYFSLRDVTLSPKQGVVVSIKRIGLSFHRPMVARPGWVSFVITGLNVSVDPEIIFNTDVDSDADPSVDDETDKETEDPVETDDVETHGWSLIPPKTRLFYIVRFILRSSRCLDITFADSSYTCQGITTISLGILHFRLDLRVGPNQMPNHFAGTLDTPKIGSGIRAYANIMLQDLYFGTPLIGQKSEEIIQNVSMNIAGILDEQDLSVTDLNFTFRLGKTSIRVDQILNVLHGIRTLRRRIMQSSLASSHSEHHTPLKRSQTLHAGLFTEQDRQNFLKLGTLLIRVVKKVDVKSESLALLGIPMSISDALKSLEHYDQYMETCNRFAFNVEDFSLDLRRLNPENPGFKLNFSEEDSAHQGILAMSSLSVGIETPKGILSEIGFVPLVSTVLRTNIFSQLLQLVRDDQKTNQSIVKAVINVCSPNININHKRGTVLLKALQDLMSGDRSVKKDAPQANANQSLSSVDIPKASSTTADESFSEDTTPTPSTVSSPTAQKRGSGFNDPHKNSSESTDRSEVDALSEKADDSGPAAKAENDYGTFFREKLLPKAFVKFTIDEPAARLILEDDEHGKSAGMVITTASKIYCDIESNHSIYKDHSNYGVDISTLSNSFETWYRSSNGERHNICLSESIHFRVRANTQPQLSLSLIGRLSNAHILLTKQEVVMNFHRVFNIIRNSRSAAAAGRHVTDEPSKHPIFLRALPKWLFHCKLEVADIAVSVATPDARYNDGIYRGLTLKVSKSIIDYRSDVSKIRNHQISAGSSGGRANADYVPRKLDTDGRRLATIFEGIEIFKVQEPHGLKFEGIDKCLSVPGFSFSCTTMTTPGVGPTVQCSSLVKTIEGQLDMNVLFLGLLVLDRLKYTFAVAAPPNDIEGPIEPPQKRAPSRLSDFVAVQIKTDLIRIKIFLPNQMKTMVEMNNLSGSHRSGHKPQAKAQYIRLYSSHPTVANAWAIIGSLKGMTTELISNAHKSEVDNIVFVNFDGMRINVPSQYVFYQLFDNIASMFKASLTLLEQHKTQEFDLVIRPKIKKLPKIPKVRVKSKTLYLTMENDHFESDLGLIFQAGLIEQKERLERERIFESKVRELVKKANETTRKKGSSHSPSSSIYGTPSISSLFSTSKKSTDDSNPYTARAGSASGAPMQRTNSNITQNSESGTAPKNTLKGHRKRTSGLKEAVHHALHPHSHLSKEHGESNYSDDYLSSGPWCSRDDINKYIETSQRAMLEHHSMSWIRTMKRARVRRAESLREYMYKNWGKDEICQDTLAKEKIVDYSDDPPLLLSAITGIDLTVSPPNMTKDEIKQFIHKIGKGMPLDTQYTLFVPLYLDFKVQEWRFQLCDYPLPFIHFPGLSESQINEGHDLASVHTKGNFFLAEKYYHDESNIRHVKVPIVPIAYMHPESEEAKSYLINVCRTVNSVKMFTDLSCDIYSANPTRITYANSMQPTLQTAMMAFDSFSKPPFDPSPKLGFWDKIRAVFHAKWTFRWHEGDVLLLLKGSRNPYELLGEASGFVMGWRNNVTFTINEDSNPQRFFVVKSEDYVLAIPNYAATEKEYLNSYKNHAYKAICPCDYSEMLNFNKVVMKFSGRVEWALGILMERNKPGDELGRTSKFVPHYEVQLKNPRAVEGIDNYDAYKGFRSEFLHMGISVKSPEHHGSQRSYNTVHLSPMVFLYFRHWWSLFDGSLSLPLRAGPLFQPDMQSKPKFGRTLYSVQYFLQLSPVFISHTYRATHTEVGSRNKESASGLKSKIGTFSMDLHQRREPGPPLPDGQASRPKRWRMKMHKGEMNFNKMDLRVLLAEFRERSPEAELAKKTRAISGSSSITGTEDGSVSSYSTYVNGGSWPHSNTHRIEITDNDFSWIDIDDYTEIGEVPPRNGTPKIRVLPFFFTPQWTYFRQTDHSGEELGVDEMGKRYMKFGHLLAHECHIGRANPEGVQLVLLKNRIHEIEDQLKTDEATLDSLHQDLEMFPNEPQVRKRAEKIAEQAKLLRHRRRVLLLVLKQNGLLTEAEEHKLINEEHHLDGEKLDSEESLEALRAVISDNASLHSESTQCSFQELNELADLSASNSSFNNRFILHHGQLKWYNTVRNALLEFNHRVSSRKHSRYFLSQKAIKYLDELIVKHSNLEPSSTSVSRASTDIPRTSTDIPRTSTDIPRTSADLPRTSTDIPRASTDIPRAQTEGISSTPRASDSSRPTTESTLNNMAECLEVETDKQEDIGLDDFLHQLLSTNHESWDSFLVKLVAPQIQLVSEQNPDQCLLVTTHDIQLEIVEITDKQMISDEVGGAVETRYGVDLNDAQFFVLNKSNVEKNSVVYFSNGHYGNEKLSSWPPWLSVELCYDSSPLKHALVVDKTNVAFKVSKPNPIYMKKLNEAPNNAKSENGSSAEEGEGAVPKTPNANGAARPSSANNGNVDDYFGGSSDNDTFRPSKLIADFSKVSATCDSSQYFAVYTIALDLLIYNEPISQKSNERVERVLLATDFNNVADLIERLSTLQNDIRRIERLLRDFEVCHTIGRLDEGARKDKLLLEVEYRYLVAELEVMMNATRVGLLKRQREECQSMLWCIAADQIIWHLLTNDRKPFLDIGLADASFYRLQHGDDYNANKITIGMMQGFNLVPNAVYQEVLAPYLRHDQEVLEKDVKFISIKWIMLGPIGGIPVMQLFETDLQPLKLQVEHDTGVKIFEYLFPSVGKDSDKDKAKSEGKDDDSDGYGSDEETDSDTQEERIKTNQSSVGGHHKHLSLLRHSDHSVRSSKVVERIESPFVIPRLKRLNTNESSHWTEGDSDNDDRTASISSSISGNNGNDEISKSGRRDLLTSDATSLRSRSTRLSTASSHGTATSDKDRHGTVVGLSAKKIRKPTRSKKEEKDNDEVSTMMRRAAKYMSIVKILIHSTELCVSYKAHGSRSFTDIHELVIKLPDFVYENKTWTNLDLALHLKKDVIKALFHHTGALIGNKFTKRVKMKKSSKPSGPLRQISDYVQFTPITELVENTRRSSIKPPLLSVTDADEVETNADSTIRKQTTKSSNDSNGTTSLKATVTNSTVINGTAGSSGASHSSGKSGINSSRSTLTETRRSTFTETPPSKTPTKGSLASKNAPSSSSPSPGSSSTSPHFSLLRRSKSRLSTHEEEPGDNTSVHSTPKKSRNIFRKLKHL